MIYQKEDADLLAGMHVLISKMGRGEKLRAIVPSSMAYGSKGNEHLGIPPYYPVIMELEITETGD